MSAEFNFLLRFEAKDAVEAENFREFVSRLRGVTEIRLAALDGDTLRPTRRLVPLPEGVPTYGDIVRSWREHLGLESGELARNAQIPPAYLSQLEHNKIKRPGESKLSRIAGALGVEYIVLLTKQLPPSILEQ